MPNLLDRRGSCNRSMSDAKHSCELRRSTRRVAVPFAVRLVRAAGSLGRDCKGAAAKNESKRDELASCCVAASHLAVLFEAASSAPLNFSFSSMWLVHQQWLSSSAQLMLAPSASTIVARVASEISRSAKKVERVGYHRRCSEPTAGHEGGRSSRRRSCRTTPAALGASGKLPQWSQCRSHHRSLGDLVGRTSLLLVECALPLRSFLVPLRHVRCSRFGFGVTAGRCVAIRRMGRGRRISFSRRRMADIER